MAWIELHQSLREHRKMFACAEMLNLSRKEMIGTLVSLWLWALDNAQDGGLDGVSNRTIASVCDWPEKKADKLVDALRSTGWIDTASDGHLAIHDWSDYAGKLMERREKDRERKRKTKENPTDLERISAGVPTDVHVNSCATVPIPYHNRTNTLPTIVGESKADKPQTRPRFVAPSVEDVRAYCQECSYTAVDPERFVSYYQANGWRVGKNPMKDWKAAVRGWNSRERDSQKTGGQSYTPRRSVPMGCGELGAAELEAIRQVLGDDPGGHP